MSHPLFFGKKIGINLGVCVYLLVGPLKIIRLNGPRPTTFRGLGQVKTNAPDSPSPAF